MPQLVKVLALDGGGIRGIIPATILARLEERLDGPIASHFDLITGTSTGGILALGLAVPGDDGDPKYPARDLVSLYTSQGGRIFSQSARKKLLDWLPFPIELDNIFDEKYSAKGLEAVLRERFGETKLSDAVTDVLVTAYGLESRDPWFFSRARARERGGEYDVPMTYVARATSAAPTYFEPLEWNGKRHDGLVDGGVFANNPTLCGWAEARARFGDDAAIFVLSLGTGSRKHPYPYAKAKGWGLAKWPKPILDIVFDGASATVDYQMDQLCNRTGRPARYYRFQPDLPRGVGAMDDASDQHVAALSKVAEDYIRVNERKLVAVCDALRELTPTPA